MIIFKTYYRLKLEKKKFQTQIEHTFHALVQHIFSRHQHCEGIEHSIATRSVVMTSYLRRDRSFRIAVIIAKPLTVLN